MKKLTLTTKGIAIAIYVLTFMALCSGVMHAQTIGFTLTTSQSNCFTIADPATSSGQCNNDATACGTGDAECDNCFDVTFYACSDDEFPNSFQIASLNCFSVCSHDGTFTDGSSSTLCTTANKQMVWNYSAGYGITTTAGGTFTICGTVANQNYGLSLIHHDGTVCNNPCTTVGIQSKN
jgi:hypothetical protein